LADPVRSRPDRQDRPVARARAGAERVSGHGLPLGAGRLLRRRADGRASMTFAGWVDTHAHLEDSSLSNDLPGVLDRARGAGVVQVIAIGTTAEDSATVVRMAAQSPGVFAAVGVHPNHAAEARPGDWERVGELVGARKVVALGETGLDRYRDNTPFPVQQEWF